MLKLSKIITSSNRTRGQKIYKTEFDGTGLKTICVTEPSGKGVQHKIEALLLIVR